MASAETVKLLGFWASPFSRRVEWALKLKGVEFEYIEEDIFNKSQLLLELNPVHQKVPVLLHNGKVVIESPLILEYIDENWKQNPLLPQDPYERSIARFWAKFADEKAMESGFCALIASSEEKEQAVKLSRETLGHVEQHLSGKKFFGGEELGYLDIAMGWISFWLPVWEEVGSVQILDSKRFPAITTWKDNFLSHPAIRDSLPPRQKTVAYFCKRREFFSSISRE